MPPIRTSLLDRLLDDAPDRAADQALTRTEEMQAIRNGFRRDLEALLNTRKPCLTPPRAYGELPVSLAADGIEDFVGAPLGTHEQRQDFVAAVERAIRTFEPRFTTVMVTLVRPRESGERRQVLRIEAVARLEHGPARVTIESAHDPVNRRFHVE